MAYQEPSTAGNYAALVDRSHGQVVFWDLEHQTLVDALKAAGLAGLPFSALDAGCGEGRLARRLRELGAAVVVGCDSSAHLIEKARQEGGAGMNYYVRDLADPASAENLPGAPFDLAICIYVLQMAKTEAELRRMCAFLARNVRPGGAALVLTVSGEYRPQPRQSALMLSAWGFDSQRPNARDLAELGAVQDGDGAGSEVGGRDGGRGEAGASSPAVGGAESWPRHVVFCFGNERVLNFQWPKETYEQCLKDAGFGTVTHFPLRRPSGLATTAAATAAAVAGGSGADARLSAEGMELLQLYLQNPHCTGFLATNRSCEARAA